MTLSKRSIASSCVFVLCASLGASLGAIASAQTKSTGGALVGTNGMTLYTFDKDEANSGKSACTGPCAAIWPPYVAAATGKPSGALSLVTREDGAKQWAYKGKPLYFFKADQKPGDRGGDNVKDVWHIVKD